jgi:pyridoxal/pyridoxine/pyridoxamine kinase
VHGVGLFVTFGCFGSKAAVFPLQLLGSDVDPVYTVQVGVLLPRMLHPYAVCLFQSMRQQCACVVALLPAAASHNGGLY